MEDEEAEKSTGTKYELTDLASATSAKQHDDGMPDGGARKRTLTAKGAQYQIDNLSRNYTSECNKLKRQCGLLTGIFESNNSDVLTQELTNLDKKFADVDDIHRNLIVFLSDGEPQQIQQMKHDTIETEVFKIKQKACAWLKQFELSTSRSHRSNSQRSRSCASSKHSKQSSHHSRRSISSNVSKLESLKAEEEILEEVQRVKNEELDAMVKLEKAKMETKRTRLKQKIVKAKLKEPNEHHVSRQEDTNTSKLTQLMDAKTTTNISETAASQHNPTGLSKNGKSSPLAAQANSHLSVQPGSELNTLITKLVDLQVTQSAPVVDIDTFNGNPLEYTYFRATFRDAVEQRVQDPRGRLTRLLKYTSGDAKELIKHCFYEDSSICYTKAIGLLDKEYGNHQLLASSYLKELRKWPVIKPNNSSAYKKLHRFLLKGLSLKRGESLKELDSEMIIRTCILAKMDRSVQEKWLNKVVRSREKDEPEMNFADIVNFVEYLSRLASDPSYSQDVYNADKNQGIGSFGVSIQLPVSSPKKPAIKPYSNSLHSAATPISLAKCVFCVEGTHTLENCHEFAEINVGERGSYALQNRLCFNCLKSTSPQHMANNCEVQPSCKQCNKRHHTLMHGYNYKSLNSYVTHSSPNETISMCIVPIRVSHKNSEDEVVTYALLDENCQGTFVTKALADQFSASMRATSITVETISGSVTENSYAVDGLLVKPMHTFGSIYGDTMIELPTSYTKEALKCHGEEVPTPDKIQDWLHLQHISDKLTDYDPGLSLGLIIGANCPKILEPQEVIPSVNDGPYASRSILGWRIIGPISGKAGSIACHRIGTRIPIVDATTNMYSRCNLALDTDVKENSLTNVLEKMYHHDFPEVNSEKMCLSNEDRQFMSLMEQEVQKRDGHYQLPLPFREFNKQLTDNKVQALQRLNSVKRKMTKDPVYKKEYCDFMETLLVKRYAVTSTECPEGRTWYLPHFGVRHPIKKKLRVVFDCSANFDGSCLNEELLQGPDLTNMLVGVLLRFRLGKIGYSADIEAMFYQVLIPPEQQSLLKFLWWPDGDTMKSPQVYQMRVHIFGAVSSPSCANFALRQVVVDNNAQNSSAGDVILNNFYVDDMLRSDDDLETVKSTVASVQELCATGGFNLTKFVCNEREIMDSIPPEKRSVDVSRILDNSTETIERALGVSWCLESDTFEFRVNLQDTPLTPRGILSTISSFYDPTGIASPFLLKGRKILQKIISLTDEWDSKVPEDLASAWTRWRNTLPGLSSLSFNRCYKPDSFGTVQKASLHIFSDASEEGYGVACYLRQVDNKNDIYVSLAFGKSRVSPLKSVTIPRLELTAAATSVKIAAMVKEELMLRDLLQTEYWSDSQICLGYISNESRRFRVFVANRVSTIRSLSRKDQWHYVATKLNPADHASRGITVDDHEAVQHWFNGPKFLWQDEEEWVPTTSVPETPQNDPEVRKIITVHVSKVKIDDTSNYLLTKLEETITSWRKMVRVVATMKSFIKRCRTKKESRGKFIISVDDLQSSERSIITVLQLKYLSKQLKFYQTEQVESSTKLSRKTDPLWKLDPFVSYDGILRVGGRLSSSSLPDEEKHPIILPSKSIISRKITEHYHIVINHLGRTSTINELRQNGYWLVKSNTVVRSIIHHCQTCKILRGKLAVQKMADLPIERFSTEGPFTATGMDMFGPFYIKEGRKENKRFVVLFTCMSSRAVHLESTININTDSFIQALRRFIARRGAV